MLISQKSIALFFLLSLAVLGLALHHPASTTSTAPSTMVADGPEPPPPPPTLLAFVDGPEPPPPPPRRSDSLFVAHA